MINYKGRVWTCNEHNDKIETMLNNGETEKAQSLVSILDPSKSRGICRECARLWRETPPSKRGE